MTSTSVKDVRSLFLNQVVPSGGKTVSGGDFHKVWSSQMNKGTDGETALGSNAAKPEQTDTTQTAKKPAADREDREVSTEGKKPDKTEQGEQQEQTSQTESSKAEVSETEGSNGVATEQETEVIGEEAQEIVDWLKPQLPDVAETGVTKEQLLAMEVLGTAALNLMEQIANVFGISMEELQVAMDSLEMGQADLMNPDMLGQLLLQLGGAEDVYALVTDGELYDNYQTIMKQLDQVLQECAKELGTEPEQLPGMFQECMEALEQESLPEETVDRRVENLREEVPVTAEKADSVNQGMTVETDQEEQAATKQETGTERQSGRGAESGTQEKTPVNHFVQEIRIEQFQPGLQQTQEISANSPWSADTRQIMEQILDYMKLSLSADTTSLEMQLHPASLGTLQVQIASKGGIVTANFITENEAVKAALEGQMIQLREQFEEQGVKVEAIEVTVQTHEFEQNLEQGRGRNGQETERKGRGRRISLSGVSAAGETEAEDGEERQVDAVMTGGSTVSYTA